MPFVYLLIGEKIQLVSEFFQVLFLGELEVRLGLYHVGGIPFAFQLFTIFPREGLLHDSTDVLLGYLIKGSLAVTPEVARACTAMAQSCGTVNWGFS